MCFPSSNLLLLAPSSQFNYLSCLALFNLYSGKFNFFGSKNLARVSRCFEQNILIRTRLNFVGAYSLQNLLEILSHNTKGV